MGDQTLRRTAIALVIGGALVAGGCGSDDDSSTTDLGEGSADEIIEARDLRQVSDSGALEAMVDEVIAANPAQVQQYLAADVSKRKKLVGFFVGQVMKVSKGQANPQMVNQLLAKKLV